MSYYHEKRDRMPVPLHAVSPSGLVFISVEVSHFVILIATSKLYRTDNLSHIVHLPCLKTGQFKRRVADFWMAK